VDRTWRQRDEIRCLFKRFILRKRFSFGNYTSQCDHKQRSAGSQKRMLSVKAHHTHALPFPPLQTLKEHIHVAQPFMKRHVEMRLTRSPVPQFRWQILRVRVTNSRRPDGGSLSHAQERARAHTHTHIRAVRLMRDSAAAEPLRTDHPAWAKQTKSTLLHS